MKYATFIVGEKTFRFEFSGEKTKSHDTMPILIHDDDLIENVDWSEEGYVLTGFLGKSNEEEIRRKVSRIIYSFLLKYGVKVTFNKFKLEMYHHYVNDDSHLQIANEIKDGFQMSEFPIEPRTIEKRISKILGVNVSLNSPHHEILRPVFCVRIVRPNKFTDNNPPHKDVYLDRLRNAVNIYFPISGSTSDSSLAILKGSHLLPESEIIKSQSGAILNSVKYTVPVILLLRNSILKMTRPNPSCDQVMVFSPYLIHGAGYNLNDDQTRVSLEMRFWRFTN